MYSFGYADSSILQDVAAVHIFGPIAIPAITRNIATRVEHETRGARRDDHRGPHAVVVLG